MGSSVARRVLHTPAVHAIEREFWFRVTATQAETFLARVWSVLTVDVHEPARPVTWCRTTYLDTEDFEYLRSSARPTERRVRVREYATAADRESTPLLTGVATLEFKASSATSRTMLRLPLPAAVAARIVRGEPLPPEWRAQLAAVPLLESVCDGLRSGWLAPRLTTWCRRLSLSGRGVRVTLDEEIVYAPAVAIGRVGEPAPPPVTIGGETGGVLELKAPEDPPGWLLAAARDLPERPISKYRAGMDLALGGRLSAALPRAA